MQPYGNSTFSMSEREREKEKVREYLPNNLVPTMRFLETERENTVCVNVSLCVCFLCIFVCVCEHVMTYL